MRALATTGRILKRAVASAALLLAVVLAWPAPARCGEEASGEQPAQQQQQQTRAQALADYFKAYYPEVPKKKPELLDTLKEIGALFAGKEIREFAWGEKFAYADLVRWNDLVNAELEKEGFHAYIVEERGRGFMYLRCLLGKLEKREAGREFEILGRKFKTEVCTVSGLLVGTERFLRFSPSFYSDRKRIYCVPELWRRYYGAVVWRRFAAWTEKGLKTGEESSLDRILPEATEDNCIEQLVYRAWRGAHGRVAAAGAKAGETFVRDCGDAMMRDCLPEEAVHAVQNEKDFTRHDEGLAQLASIAAAEHPHAVLAEIYCYRRQPEASPYRQAYERALPLLAGKVLELARADKALAASLGAELPADAAAAKPLLYRLDEAALRKAAGEALKELVPKPETEPDRRG